MKSISLMLLMFVFVLGCAQNKTKPITELSQNDIESGILIDVRTPEEFKMGHIDEALNINWFDADFTEQFETIKKDQKIFLYCKVGGRSAKAQEKLESLGYKNVINLDGGYDAYAKKE